MAACNGHEEFVAITPKKLHNIECALCLTTTDNNSFKLSGKKCIENNTFEKLECILGPQGSCLLEKLRSLSALHCEKSKAQPYHREDSSIACPKICRPCFTRVNKSYEFQIDCAAAINQYISGHNQRAKRAAKDSPTATLADTDVIEEVRPVEIENQGATRPTTPNHKVNSRTCPSYQPVLPAIQHEDLHTDHADQKIHSLSTNWRAKKKIKGDRHSRSTV